MEQVRVEQGGLGFVVNLEVFIDESDEVVGVEFVHLLDHGQKLVPLVLRPVIFATFWLDDLINLNLEEVLHPMSLIKQKPLVFNRHSQLNYISARIHLEF